MVEEKVSIIERLKSPVVVAQLVSIIFGVLIFFAPELTEEAKIVSGAIIAVLNIFAGINNPTTKDSF